jgi:mono/diheme cytochrome c family protein
MKTFLMNGELRLLSAIALVLALGACGHHFEPPVESDRIAEAEALYSTEIFDSLTWESDYVRALEGNSVYVDACRKCHGSLGEGTTDYAEGRDLDVPSLVAANWDFSAGIESVRHQVFVGHEGGMPTFGTSRLTPRQMDGAAYYVVAQLRPEMLQQD